ncbi:GH1 family beta-glucosidase [Deinococcus sp. 6GRE01]|uniref:GH1 family beta-glucosidase n=1 Tax=Deinococcus sp. 6GRE01 TaxID=2745873 RepID=UPI001E5B4220|nr:GH1 family beta-glucosidase [Deinococcus sp. 6GRE01]MCD0157521.1 beta-glucosidase [Deinococcus sp. 6GRE01]
MTNTLTDTTALTPAARAANLTRRDFPAGFVFGVATSSYQIEGAAQEDGRSPSIWDVFCAQPGRISDGSSGAVACDHYHRWEQDLDLIAALGVDAYRFSVAWPRVIPAGRGPVNPAGLDFYERLTDGLLARGVQPHVTLYHWDLPATLQDQGGWTNRDTAYAFAEYSAAVAGRLGNRVVSYATLNEPWCSSVLSYEIGEHAPGTRDRAAALSAAHHLMLGHGLAMPEIRRHAPQSQAGIVLNLGPQESASDHPEDIRAARHADGRLNRWFLDPLLRGEYPADTWEDVVADAPPVQDGDLRLIAAPMDFLGVNYYSRGVIGAQGGVMPEGASVTDMGWEIHPQGLTDLMLRLKADYPALPPIYITENGAAFADERSGDRVHDPRRTEFISTHLSALLDATQAGVDVRGYFAWSLMDNFEWAHGYQKRFGLVYVDYATQERLLKDSALWYQAFLK